MKSINNTTIIIAFTTLIVGLGLGWLLFGSTSEKHNHESHDEQVSSVWTCSMHPQIRKNEPGDCPICGMDLIPVSNMETSVTNPMEIRMSPTAMQLASVQTAIVKKEKPTKTLRMNGKVQVNESLVSSQTSHISGRIEKLLINTTGEYVSKGQIMAYVYSPELVTAQEELFEAEKIKDSQSQLFKASKEKLKNWKLTDKQIDAILNSGKPIENFPILSDINGVVINKRVNLGDYIKTGTSLFEVADLSKVWVLFDVYESDMEWVKVGDTIEYTVQSIPSASFKGKVTFIDPVINPKTRVAKARLVVNNKADLKPEMFVSGTLKSKMLTDEEELVVPKSAVMWTGEKSVVYVKSSDIGGVNFLMREVSLGASLGDSYVVNEGLEEGEEIAIHGTFSIDAAAQLAGKPSMMNPEGGVVMTGHNHARLPDGQGGGNPKNTTTHANHSKSVPVSKEVKQALSPLFDSYLALKNALVKDDFSMAVKSAKEYQEALSKTNMSIFKGEAHNVWMEHSVQAKKSIASIVDAKDIMQIRKHFVTLSEQMVMIAKTFEPNEESLFIQHCPMADEDNGADWLSTENEIKNPYFGASMLKCGEVKEKIK